MARKQAVVHAQRAHHLGRKHLPRSQLADGDPVGETHHRARCFFGVGGQHVAHDRERNRQLPRALALVDETIDQRRHRVAFAQDVAWPVDEEASEDALAQGLRPARRRAFPLLPAVQFENLLAVAREASQALVVGGAGVETSAAQGARHHALEVRRLVGGGVAEHESFHAFAPSVRRAA